MITENLPILKIHKLTQAQYDRELEAGRIDETAIYLTPDDESVDSKIATHDTAADAHSDLRSKLDAIPNWAKAANKPTYTASEVGAAEKSEGVVFVEGSGTTDGTTNTSTWIGTSDRITEYYDGMAIRYKIGVDGESTVTLNINNLGAKTIYRFGTTKLTTQFPVGSIITLIYHEDLNDGCWVTNDYDANTNTQQRVYVTTTNKEYPITARYNTTTGSTYYAEYGRYSTGVTLNPSTNTITATTFKGTATKATGDGDGNNIASTYAKKADAETWTFTLKDGTTVTKKVVLG